MDYYKYHKKFPTNKVHKINTHLNWTKRFPELVDILFVGVARHFFFNRSMTSIEVLDGINNIIRECYSLSLTGWHRRSFFRFPFLARKASYCQKHTLVWVLDEIADETVLTFFRQLAQSIGCEVARTSSGLSNNKYYFVLNDCMSSVRLPANSPWLVVNDYDRIFVPIKLCISFVISVQISASDKGK